MWIGRGEMRKKIGASGQGQLRFKHPISLSHTVWAVSVDWKALP